MAEPSKPRSCVAMIYVLGLSLTTNATADTGTAGTALPGLFRVAASHSGEPGTAVASSVGFGRSSGVLAGDDSHLRFLGRFAAAWRATGWLALGLQLDGRVDTHAGAMAAGDTFVGDPRVIVRLVGPRGRLRLGAELRVWFPGDDVPSIVPAATSIDAVGIASLALTPQLRLHVNAGGRFDRSARSIDDASTLPAAQRLVLGLSDSHAVLLGAGAGYRVGDTEVLAEWTWDLLIGDGAPTASQAPMRIATGVRHALTASLSLQASLELSINDTPSLASPALIPVDPRLSFVASLVYRRRPPTRRPRAPLAVTPRPPAPTPAPPAPRPAPPPARAVVSGRVIAGDSPVAGAEVRLSSSAGSAVTGATGRFELRDVVPGSVTATVRAKGYRSFSRTISVKSGARHSLGDLRLEAELPPGELCVVALPVRSRRRVPRRVIVTIEPGARRLTGPPGKELCATLAPGRYRVSVSAQGYRTATRAVVIRKHSGQTRNISLRPR